MINQAVAATVFDTSRPLRFGERRLTYGRYPMRGAQLYGVLEAQLSLPGTERNDHLHLNSFATARFEDVALFALWAVHRTGRMVDLEFNGYRTTVTTMDLKQAPRLDVTQEDAAYARLSRIEGAQDISADLASMIGAAACVAYERYSQVVAAQNDMPTGQE